MTPTRRRFLLWAGVAVAGGAALGWGAASWWSFEARLRRAGAVARACYAGHDRAAVLAVGRAWLAAVAPERGDRALAEAFAGVLSDLERAGDPAERIAADWRELRTVDVEGWTLSATEVALAALLDLEP